jgi:hypothetical protein
LKLLTFIVFLFFAARQSAAQSSIGSLGLWHFNSLTGSLKTEGRYRDQQTIVDNYSEFPKLYYLSGGLQLNSHSYVWHPNFLQIDMGLDLNPGTSKADYIVIPDFSETTTLNQAEITATFFEQKNINFSVTARYHKNIINRENLNSVNSDKFQWGGAVSYRNKILPVELTFFNADLDQEELPSRRKYDFNQQNMQVIAEKSFSTRDKHKLLYSREDFFRKEAEFEPIANLTNSFELHNEYTFDQKKNYTFTSDISNIDRRGSGSYNRLRTSENLIFKLPHNFRLTTTYRYEDFDYRSQRLKQHSVIGKLSHQLFSSLRSSLFYEYHKLNQTTYEQGIYYAGFNFDYTKNVFKSGKLSVTYQAQRYHQDQTSSDVLLSIVNEEYTLTDGEVTLLKSPYIDINTITVEDISATIIYLPGLDYLLFEVNN